MDKLEKFPDQGEIQQKLKISFDSLGDDRMIKNIFLDIACFSIGMDKEYATKIFHGCGFFPDIDLKILMERSLVTVDFTNKLRMHDLIRNMGSWEIVRKRSLKDLGRHSRLWFYVDVLIEGTKQTAGKRHLHLINNHLQFCIIPLWLEYFSIFMLWWIQSICK